MRSVALTSRSPPPPRLMMKREPCLPPSVSRSRIEVGMAKLSLINREEKRARMVKKYAAKRAELKAVIASVATSDEDRITAYKALQGGPRGAGPGGRRGRGRGAGRPRGGGGGGGRARG